MASGKKSKSRSDKSAVADKSAVGIHAQHSDGIHHVVGLANIRVLILKDGPFWHAQGLDLDYAAQGHTPEETRKNFEIGLKATIDQHLRMYGHLGNFFKITPAEICHNLLLEMTTEPVHLNRYSQISGHEIHEAIPYRTIEYLVASVAA
jgi:hypothetical protein